MVTLKVNSTNTKNSFAHVNFLVLHLSCNPILHVVISLETE